MSKKDEFNKDLLSDNQDKLIEEIKNNPFYKGHILGAKNKGRVGRVLQEIY